MQESTQQVSNPENFNEEKSLLQKTQEGSSGHPGIARLLDCLPGELSGNVISMSIESHAGPLPSPSVLAEYDRVCPGAAERILRMAEMEQVHRHEGESAIHFSQPAIFKRGQAFAFLTCFLGILGAVVLGLMGRTTVAIALGAGPPIVLAGGFIGRRMIESTKNMLGLGEEPH